jgi:hypothetical protein
MEWFIILPFPAISDAVSIAQIQGPVKPQNFFAKTLLTKSKISFIIKGV